MTRKNGILVKKGLELALVGLSMFATPVLSEEMTVNVSSVDDAKKGTLYSEDKLEKGEIDFENAGYVNMRELVEATVPEYKQMEKAKKEGRSAKYTILEVAFNEKIAKIPGIIGDFAKAEDVDALFSEKYLKSRDVELTKDMDMTEEVSKYVIEHL
jgi:hypothetical protein